MSSDMIRAWVPVRAEKTRQTKSWSRIVSIKAGIAGAGISATGALVEIGAGLGKLVLF
jgi:hypothetical protein